MKLLGIKVEDRTHNRVTKLADAKGCTVSAMARDLLEQSLSRQEVDQALASLDRRVEVLGRQIAEIHGLLHAQLKAGTIPAPKSNITENESFSEYKKRLGR